MRRTQVSTDRTSLALAALRIFVGLLFLIFGEYKVFGAQFTLRGGFEGWIHQFLQSGAAYPFFAPILEKFVLPHAHTIAFLVAYGELAIGVALLLGLCVRLASAFGLAYMLSLLFASNFPGHEAQFWQYFGASLDHSVLAFCFLCFIIARADERLCVMSYLRKEKPRLPPL
ncbi:MAG TPA: DoxX family protein [Terracidiphilus sp.]|nr:DoxX family protein [Terracidiphilus sp.]